jgi:DNA recombination protein RmuC
MSLVELSTIASLILVLIFLAINAFYVKRTSVLASNSNSDFATKLARFENAFTGLDRGMRDEFSRGREETGANSKLLREEVSTSFGALASSVTGSITALAQTERALLEGFGARLNEMKADATTRATAFREEVQETFRNIADRTGAALTHLGNSQSEKLDGVTKQVGALTEGNERRQEVLRENVEARLIELKSDAAQNGKALREEIVGSLKTLGEVLAKGVEQLTETQKERLNQFSLAIDTLTKRNNEQQDALRISVETRLEVLRTDNADKLEQMRLTVDEKLHNTLEQRLGASFKVVSDQLEQVFRGVGEMQSLATGVGDLKKVLSNVKMRGTWAEVSLGNLLEQVMAPEQFARNVEIIPGSGQRVEYAIKLPGTGDAEGPLWIPIDAKFPTEDYERLVEASELGDLEAIEQSAKALEVRLRVAAKDICTKYVHPPHSTDFAILFLPTEGLFAETIRRPGLLDALQNEYRVVVTGPTTLMALLNSLRMGFRTLAIQKRSGEVWQVLGAVKAEFGKYGQILDKVQKKLQEASKTIDEVAVRKRAIDRRLNGVELLTELDAAAVLGLGDKSGLDGEMEPLESDDAILINEENGPIDSSESLLFGNKS